MQSESLKPALTRREISHLIRSEWRDILRRSGVAPCTPPKSARILGASHKTDLSLAIGRKTGVAYLAPSGEAWGSIGKRTTCANAIPACIRNCLGVTSGRMVMTPVRNARLWKTALRFGRPDLFAALVKLDATALEREAAKLSLAPRIRLDGSTDLGDSERYAGSFPGIGWYEYTKSEARARRWLDSPIPNLHSTLSYTAATHNACLRFVADGGNVAVATDLAKTDIKPSALWGFPAIDGDAHDDRSADAPGAFVLLSWKGPRSGLDTADGFAARIRCAS